MIPPADVRRTVLPNGLTVLARRDATAPVTAVVTWVKAGYFDETDDVIGIAHVLEHLYFKGTATLGPGELAKRTKACGGILNAATIYDHTMYYAVVPSASFEEALTLQADAWANPAIDRGELARELEVIIQEVHRKQDTPSPIATETLFEVLHDRHRIRRWRMGHPDALRALRREDLVGFHRAYYVPSNTIVAVVGDVDPDAATAAVARAFGGVGDGAVPRDRGPAETARPGFRWREWSGDIAQAELRIGWRTVPNTHPDAPALDLAAAVLGSGRASRLHAAVRERALASTVSTWHYTPEGLGVLVVAATAPGESAREALGTAWREVRRLADDGCTADELARAQRLYEVRWLRQHETMDGQAAALAEWEAVGDWRAGERWLEALRAVTPQALQAAVRRHLDPEHAAVVVYRPHAMPPIASGAADGRRLLDAADAPAVSAPVVAPAVLSPAGAPIRDRVHGDGSSAIHVFRTRDGLPLLVRRKPGAPVAHVAAWMAGGACDEPAADAGLSMLTARAMVKGTATRDAATLAIAAEQLGGALSASTGAESSGWSISVPVDALEPALALLADVVLAPSFPDAVVETERRVAIGEAARLADDMARYPLRLVLEAAWAGHPYGVAAAGDETTLARLTRDRLADWHARRVATGGGAVGLVGDLPPEDGAALLARAFGAWTPGTPPALPIPAWPAAGAQRVVTRDKAQTALAMAFPAPSRDDPDHVAFELVAGIASGLGGRFFEALRDAKSLAYTVSASPVTRRRAGMFTAYIATDPAREDEAREGLLAEFARLVDAPVGADELARAQAYALGVRAIRQQSGGVVLGEVLDAWLLGEGLDELDAWAGRIRSATPATLQRLAAQWFDPARRVEGIVRGRRA